jgi:uncharacterized protein YukE
MNDHVSGMDIAEVRSLARRMDAQGAQVQRLLDEATAKVRSARWVGRDREAFLTRWESQEHALRQVAVALAEASRAASEYANRQEWASR